MADHDIAGRFAPSPTGALHFGSLIAALGSFLNIRHHGGKWYVRIEDLDLPREQPGAGADILRTLETFGLAWDGDVIRQSGRGARYEQALDRLVAGNLIYHCTCSRKDIQLAGKPGIEGQRYPGTCRTANHNGHDASIRLRTHDEPLTVIDIIHGPSVQRLETEIGDFILKRRDGLYAYQLAVVVDDAEQGITEVVRGCDLLNSTPRQVYLQQCLGLTTPAYIHLPLAVNRAGEKLSKQTGAAPIAGCDPVDVLLAALAFLGQRPPAELREGSVSDVIGWAVSHWSLAAVPKQRTITSP